MLALNVLDLDPVLALDFLELDPVVRRGRFPPAASPSAYALRRSSSMRSFTPATRSNG